MQRRRCSASNILIAMINSCQTLAVEVDTSFAGLRVTRVLDQIIAERGLPRAIRCDNGPS